MWNGSADSWMDLSPVGSMESGANAVWGEMQVGYSYVGGVFRASLWRGSAGTWEDLSLGLPGAFEVSTALGAWSDGSRAYVTGYGYNSQTGRNEALLWTQSIPEPGVWAGLAGVGAFVLRRGRR